MAVGLCVVVWRLYIRRVNPADRPSLVVARHGETAWTISGRHTGRTDVGLTENGTKQAASLRAPLATWRFARVWTSPLTRARETCALAGFGDVTEVVDDAVEWDYGAYEGLTTAEIRTTEPGWSLWRDGVAGGETAEEVVARADRVIGRALGARGDTLLFSHGHFLRVLAARWLELDASAGRFFRLSPASISCLGWEREQRVLNSWNTEVA